MEQCWGTIKKTQRAFLGNLHETLRPSLLLSLWIILEVIVGFVTAHSTLPWVVNGKVSSPLQKATMARSSVGIELLDTIWKYEKDP